MTMEEYKKQFVSAVTITPSQYSEPLFDCPKCGGGMCRNEMIVLPSLPPKHEYVCNICGHIERF